MSEVKNITASIRAKLRNIANKEHKPFDFILMLYMIERLLYRLSVSKYSDNFILKGGLFLYITIKEKARPTKDIDFLAKQLSNDISKMHNIFNEICKIKCQDGLLFEEESITAEKIKEDAEYEGIRIKIKCYLGNAFKILQLDIGFGDVVVPKPVMIEYPILLDMNPPEIKAYSIESVISEKFEAMISLSLLNSRMKDFYDIWILSKKYMFDGRVLYEAIFETFNRRGTHLNKEPAIFSKNFYIDKSKQKQWTAFTNRIGQKAEFELVMKSLENFLKPVYYSLLNEIEFSKNWDYEKNIWV
jgi:predicted nucleotidyltransferase component of viral defense system